MQSSASWAANEENKTFDDKFRQLDELLPTPNDIRNASGAPATNYWQQKVDYKINVQLDEKRRTITGSEIIVYHNNSPDRLDYLWLHLDQNRFRADSIGRLSQTQGQIDALTYEELRNLQYFEDFAGGFEISSVGDAKGESLPHTIVGALMRVNLAEPLAPGASAAVSVEWSYNIADAKAAQSGREGYEHFPEDGNDIFLIAQWHPRAAAYTDYEGWHNKEFIGAGEFTLEFGGFDVSITVPDDHVVSSTGVLQNPAEVLTPIQQQRLKMAQSADSPVFIVTPGEALANEKKRSKRVKTWRFKAENVRDFAWASSRKFIWDAQGHRQKSSEAPLVMAMSFYPKEGEPLWSRYSTPAIIHTLEVYSRFTFPYPYPVAQSVNGPVIGIEYPMISFNGPRTEPEPDGTRTYSRAQKFFLIAVVMHEVGHNYLPMIVNSDERQWAWMDEGPNSFLQYIAQKEWDDKFESYRGEPRWVVDYMKGGNQSPIMTSADSLLQGANSAYAKPAAALTVLRETILGRKLFDDAFRQYATRWKFRRPTPADFFRTMEEASGVDLDWFWRGWFYTNDYVDISIDSVTKLELNTNDPDIENPLARKGQSSEPFSRLQKNNAAENRRTRVEQYPALRDFYDEYDQFTVTEKDRSQFESYLSSLHSPMDPDPDWRKKTRSQALKDDKNYYALDFSNIGGLVSPIILEIKYRDGSTEEIRLPAEIWRRSPTKVRKLIVRKKEIVSVLVDPYLETADVDASNNYYPQQIPTSRIDLQKSEFSIPGIPNRNLMKEMK